MTDDKLKSQMNELVATWSVLYTKLHNFHWNVTGPSFFTLHDKFKELYDEVAHYFDDYAERLLTLNQKPAATLSEHLKLSLIKEATGEETAEKMVQAIINDFTIIMDTLKDAMTSAAEVEDESTVDMLNATHINLEKHVWMMKAFLG